MSSDGSGRAFLRASAAIAPALTIATLLQYVLQVIAAKRLPTGDFGAFGSLLALTVVGAVPLFAVQAVVARRVAARVDDPLCAGIGRGSLVPSLRCGLLVGGGAGLLAWPTATFLHVPLAAALMMALALVPLPLVGAALGAAQGQRKHGEFVALYLAYSATRLLFVIPVLWLHPTTTAAMGGVAAGSFAAGGLGTWLLLRTRAASQPAPRFGRDVLTTSLALLSVLALASTDLLLARHRLPAAASDLYALGSLGARAVFWLLQFAGVAAYAELASHASAAHRRRTLLSGFGVVVGLGLVGTGIAFVLPEQSVTTMLRPEYAPVVPLLPLFAALGTALAAAQYLVMAGVARGRERDGALLVGAAIVEALVLLFLPNPTVGRMVSIAAGITALAACGLLVTTLRQVDDAAPLQDVELPGQGGGL